MTVVFEQFVLDGLALNDGVNFTALELDGPPAPLRQRWMSGVDADGDVLVEPSKRENRTWTIKLQVAKQATTDLFLAKIGQIVDKLYESEQQSEQGGLPGVWTPADATKAGTIYVLSGEIIGLPISFNEGWFAKAPNITIRLDCDPFMRGAEVTSAATVTNSLPYQVLTVGGVTGDVPAEARLVVTDAASKDRRHFEWGTQWRYYDAATSLYIDSDSMVTSGFSGVQTTRTGADDPNATGNNVIRGTLTTMAQAICGLGNLGHVGNYRLKLRVYSAQVNTLLDPSTVQLRLSWKEGDGPLRSNAWVSPVLQGGFAEVDLGTISVPQKTLGTQRWTGQIEGVTSGTAGDTLDVDFGLLFPTDRYGKARIAPTVPTPTLFSARDEFDQTAGALTAKTSPVGGNWATAGAATDFTVDATNHWITRSADDTTPGRAAWLPVSLTNTVTQVDFKYTDDTGINQPGFATPYIMGRYIDESNYLIAFLSFGASGIATSVALRVRIAGVNTTIANLTFSQTIGFNAWCSLRLVVDIFGVVSFWFGPRGAALPRLVQASHSSLATGGALASGFPGFRDTHPAFNTVTRFYDNFWAAGYTLDAVVFSTRSAEINSQKGERADSTGTYYGPFQTYRGARFYLQPAGDENRTNRVLTKTRRNDIETMTDDAIADSTTVTIHYTPRWSVVPR